MLSRVLRTIRRNEMLLGAGQERVLCAVSGGADSMAMLACLWELAPRLRLTIEVATVDHGLRPEAAREAAMVQERAAALGLVWHGLTVDVRGARARRSSSRGAANSGGGGRAGEGDAEGRGDGDGDVGDRGGVQEVARRLRLAALAALAVRRGLGSVALAHQADDQAETVLFRILRGTGVAGLAGIPYRRPPFVRPLLDVSRADILQYLARRSLPHVEDPSNHDVHYARARVRHQILPLLRQENPRVDQALRSLAAASVGHVPSSPTRDKAATAGVHVPLRLASEIDAVAREGAGTRTFDLAGGARVTVSYGQVNVHAAPGRSGGAGPMRGGPRGDPPEARRAAEADEHVRVTGPGHYRFASHQVVVREVVGESTIDRADATGTPPNPSSEAMGVPLSPGAVWTWFDGETFPWPLLIRSRRPGDRMRPRGGAGSRKVAELLIAAKVPRGERAHLPVVVGADNQVLFVPGLRPGGGAGPTALTRRWIGLAAGEIPDHDGRVDPSGDESNTGTASLSSGFPGRSMSVECSEARRVAPSVGDDP